MVSASASLFRLLPRPVAGALRAIWRCLPPAARRYRLQNLATAARQDRFIGSPDYIRFCAIEAGHWADRAAAPAAGGRPPAADAAFASPAEARGEAAPPLDYFLQHPHARRLFYRAPGFPHRDIWEWMQSRGRHYPRLFVPGAGPGVHCRLLIDLGLATRVDANDISATLAARAQAAYATLGYDIRYIAADLNTIELPVRAYDACLAMHAFHHVIRLERLFARLARALEPEGDLFVEEYVGPRFVHSPRSVRRAARKWLRRLPPHLTRDKSGAPLRALHFKDKWEVQKYSPFESIRSDRVLPALREHFTIHEYHELGGGILMPLLEHIIHNFDPENSGDNAWLEAIFDDDRELTFRGAIPNSFVLLRATPRACPPSSVQ